VTSEADSASVKIWVQGEAVASCYGQASATWWREGQPGPLSLSQPVLAVGEGKEEEWSRDCWSINSCQVFYLSISTIW